MDTLEHIRTLDRVQEVRTDLKQDILSCSSGPCNLKIRKSPSKLRGFPGRWSAKRQGVLRPHILSLPDHPLTVNAKPIHGVAKSSNPYMLHSAKILMQQASTFTTQSIRSEFAFCDAHFVNLKNYPSYDILRPEQLTAACLILSLFCRCHMRELCVTCCGLIPMTGAGGGSPPEVQATRLGKTSRSSSTTPTSSPWSPEPTSW